MNVAELICSRAAKRKRAFRGRNHAQGHNFVLRFYALKLPLNGRNTDPEPWPAFESSGPDRSSRAASPTGVRQRALAAGRTPQPINDSMPGSDVCALHRCGHPRNHTTPRPDNPTRAAFDWLTDFSGLFSLSALALGRRQPVGARLGEIASRARLRRFALPRARRDRQLQQRANLFLERS